MQAIDIFNGTASIYTGTNMSGIYVKHVVKLDKYAANTYLIQSQKY